MVTVTTMDGCAMKQVPVHVDADVPYGFELACDFPLPYGMNRWLRTQDEDHAVERATWMWLHAHYHNR